MTTINNKTKVYLSCSSKPGNFGAYLYNYIFNINNINSVYIPRKCTNAEELINLIKLIGINGCSVSMPMKNSIINYLDEVDSVGVVTKSVNTIVNKDSKLVGYNTDVYGVLQSLKDINFDNVIIYGSGSVVDSILYALRIKNIKNIFISSRNLFKSKNKYKNEKSLKFIDSNKSINKNFDLFINATPAQIDNPQIINIFNHTTKIFDLNVSFKYTDLIKLAKRNNKHHINGLKMAIYQFKKQINHYEDISISYNEINEIISSYNG